MQTAEAKTKEGAGAGGQTNAEANAAAQTPATQAEQTESRQGYIPFAEAGRTFTAWFNAQLAAANNPTITLGTKTATAIMLRDDGSLAVEVDGPDVKGERQSVALDRQHLDELMPQFRKPGV